MVGVLFGGGLWSVVGAGGGRWSVSNVVGGRCFAFLLVGGRFLFLRMVGGRCLKEISIWLVVGGSWSVVCAGGWSVGGGFVLRPFCSYIFHCKQFIEGLTRSVLAKFICLITLH